MALVGFFLPGPQVHADTIFVANMVHLVINFSPAGTIEKFDSNGTRSRFASGLFGPRGIAVDTSSNLYVAISSSRTIMRFDPSGNGSVFAHTGSNVPVDLAFDKAGNLYVSIADDIDGTTSIERFDSSGNGEIFASGLLGSDSSNPSLALAFDPSGNLYIALPLFGSGKIEKFDPMGNASVFADMGPDTAVGLAVDSCGNVYAVLEGLFFRNPRIEKFDPSGNGTIFVNSGLSGPVGLAFDSTGNLYVANAGNGTIMRFDPSGNGSVFASGLIDPEFITVLASGPVDSDGDGVPDDQDQCSCTPPGAVVDAHGCSIDQLVPCAGPASGGTWKNHGEYVSAIVEVSARFLADGLISSAERTGVVRQAAEAGCGKK